MEMLFNKYQTQLTPEVIEQYPPEVIDELWEYINAVPFIQRLVSPDRKYARDLERDEEGKIIVDLANPHILENMDYFRQTAIHYKEHGCYTKLRVNTNQQSEWMKWFKQELMRCWFGMVRPEDGEWITGDMYFFLNYSIMTQTIIKYNSRGKKYGIRTEEFPECWEGIYWRFHYLDQARYGGLYNNWDGGQHAAEIASRGKGKSYSLASILQRLFTIGIGPGEFSEKRKALIVADLKTYLIDDGTLNKFESGLAHLQKNTQFPAQKLRESLTNMYWESGWVDTETKQEKGSKNLVLGQAIGDDADKSRGKRPNCLTSKVVTPEGIKIWKDIKIGDYLFGDDGKPTKVIDIPFEGEDDIYRITLKDGRTTDVGKDHLFEIINWEGFGKNRKRITEILSTTQIIDKLNNNTNSNVLAIRKNNCVEFKEKPLFIDPYVMGLYLGDGCYQSCSAESINLTMRVDDFNNIKQYIPYKTKTSVGREITHKILLLEDNRKSQYKRNPYAKMVLTHYGLDNKCSSDKFIPKEYIFNSKENRIKLLKGLLDSDGTCTTQGCIEYATKSESLKNDFMFLCRSLGINCSCYLKQYHRLDNTYYRVKLHVKDKELFNLKRKQDRVKTEHTAYGDSFSERTSIVSVEYLGKKPCKCVTVDNDSHLYLIDDFIINHNSDWMLGEEFGKFGKFSEWWSTSMPNVQEGEIVFGLGYVVGTGGTEGADFTGALDMIYAPESNHIYGLPNVYDKGSNGAKKTVFFYPSYVNYKPYYNEDGVSDVIGAMLSELKQRYDLKYSSNDPNKITRRKAEFAFTIQDAIMRRDSTVYPVSDLNDRINQIDSDPNTLSDMWVGNIEFSHGEVKWKPNPEVHPILNFPHKDNKMEGAIHIKAMPVKDSNNRVPWGRYIAGCDPYDDDASNTLSLGAMYILDLWTDDIVAEYVGRPMFADDFYENCRRLLLMYNAECNYENNKKGIFGYFSRHNCLHLLCDTLEFLKDKDDSRISYGNKAKGTANYSNTKAGGISAHGRRMGRDFLLKPYRYDVVEIIDNEEVIVEKTIPNLFRIKYRALLQELAMWNTDGNFDRHDAFVMLMLIREDKLIMAGDSDLKSRHEENDANYLGNDDFFNKNYGGNKESKLDRQLKKLNLLYPTK